MRTNCWPLLLLLEIAASASVVAQEPPSYARDIRPLLADRCWTCHGPDESAREADLRLDRYSEATADRDGSAAIVPGDAEGSELIQRITSGDRDTRMPPESTGKALYGRSNCVVATLDRAWGGLRTTLVIPAHPIGHSALSP